MMSTWGRDYIAALELRLNSINNLALELLADGIVSPDELVFSISAINTVRQIVKISNLGISEIE